MSTTFAFIWVRRSISMSTIGHREEGTWRNASGETGKDQCHRRDTNSHLLGHSVADPHLVSKEAPDTMHLLAVTGDIGLAVLSPSVAELHHHTSYPHMPQAVSQTTVREHQDTPRTATQWYSRPATVPKITELKTKLHELLQASFLQISLPVIQTSE